MSSCYAEGRTSPAGIVRPLNECCRLEQSPKVSFAVASGGLTGAGSDPSASHGDQTGQADQQFRHTQGTAAAATA